MEEFLLVHTLQAALQSGEEAPFNLSADEAACEALLLLLLVRHQAFAETGAELRQGYLNLLEDSQVRDFLGFNRYGGLWWLNRERLEALNYWLFLVSALQCLETEPDPKKRLERIAEFQRFFEGCLKAAEKAQYQVEKFRKLL